MVLQDLTLGIVGNVDVAEVFSPAVRGDDEDLLVFRILDDSRVRALLILASTKWRVRVAAHDQVQACRALGQFLVFFVADVRESGDASDVGSLADFINSILNSLHRVREDRAFAWAGNVGSSLGRDTDDCDAILLVDMVGLDCAVQYRIVALDVGADDRESKIVQKFSQRVVASVELMVTKSHAIESELVESLCDLFPAIIRVKQSTLELIACIEEKRRVQSGSDLIDHSRDACVASITATFRILTICARAPELVQMGVYVVDVEETLVPVAVCVDVALLELSLADQNVLSEGGGREDRCHEGAFPCKCHVNVNTSR